MFGVVRPAGLAVKVRGSRVFSRYALYGLGLVALIVLSIAFWARSASSPILFPYRTGRWLRQNPSLSVIIWTVVGAILSTITAFLLNGLLALMSRQLLASDGVSFSTIETWQIAHNHGLLFDVRRPGATIFTFVLSAAMLYLATAYTTLLTPVNILVGDSIRGTEVDFTSSEFWDWYNYRDADGQLNRTVQGCTWYTYQSPQGELIYHTCPFIGNPVGFLSSGISSSDYYFSATNSTVNLFGKQFEGSTGGILPLGWEGFAALSDVRFDTWDQGTSYPDFNYTISQQGLTAEVTCEESSTSPITRTILDEYSVDSAGGGKVELQNFQCVCPLGTYVNSIITATISSAALFVCPRTAASKEDYTIHVRPFDGYATPNSLASNIVFPNMTCSLTPYIANATVLYTASDRLFHISSLETIPLSTSQVPNETADAISQVFQLATSTWGNMLIDSLYAIILSNQTTTFAQAMEISLRGIIQFEGSNLRVYYGSNEPPGRHAVQGSYTVWRVGYNGRPVVLISLLPPLVIILVLAVAYVVIGSRTTGTGHVSDFDPINTVCLITAAAVGGASGLLPARNLVGGMTRPRDRKILGGVRLVFDDKDGLIETKQEQQRQQQEEEGIMLVPKSGPVAAVVDERSE
ncbi:hypothetical protein PV04_02342 [Phialophora macrospora]|uniref:Uncharacterized protein n=1 Tax=Phialophora macrospora TaxID=1851006 RepID=A0A0D2CXZ6_9EURO|nr:hypothetical protein PV04_02342 [Phialophora macrospora]